MLHAYLIWCQCHNQKQFGTDETKEDYENKIKNEKIWGEKFFIDISAMYECHQQIKETTTRLENMGIKPFVGTLKTSWTDTEKTIILKVVIAGNYIHQIEKHMNE